MAGLQITITDAGRAALPNGPNTGTSAVTISHVGVSSVHTPGSLKGLTALPGEVKRVTTFGGDIVADDVIHVTINDETTAVYSVRSFGLYLSTGVLFAVFSSPDVVVEKSAGAMVLLSADITFKTLDTAVIQFGGTGFINPPATTERVGVVELATWEEAAAGARADVVVTPFGLLKTFQSWATNFAAAIHRHAMSSIDGLPEALAGKSATGHKHDAGDTTSGVFDVGRIPALAMEKITGLAMALALKASLGAVVSFNDVRTSRGGRTGVLYFGDGDDFIVLSNGDMGTNRPFNSPSLTSGGNAVWHASNFNPATKAGLNENVTFADIRAFRANGTGAVYLGDLAHYLFFDGLNYNLPAAPLISNGGIVWTSATFDPAAKADRVNPEIEGQITIGSASAMMQVRHRDNQPRRSGIYASEGMVRLWDSVWGDLAWFTQGELALLGANAQQRFVWHTANFNPADKANALHSHDWGQVTGKPAWVDPNAESVISGYKAFTATGSTIAGGTDGHAALEVRGSPGGNAAYLAFHRPGVQAAFLGLDTDGQWKVGGWSMGAVAHRLHHTGNLTFAGGGTIADPSLGPNVHDQMISPAGLWSFARNMGSPGYAVIPGTGLMIQWGLTTANIAEGETHAYLPVAFGGGCLVALANPRNPNRNINTDFYMQVVGHFADRIAFFANRANGSSGNLDGYEWVAIGRVSGAADPAYSSGSSGGVGGGGGGYVEP